MPSTHTVMSLHKQCIIIMIVIIDTKVFMKTDSIIFDTPRPSLDLTDFFFFSVGFFFTAWKISVLRLDSCVLKEQFTKSLKFSHHLLPPLPDWAWGVLSFLFVFYVTTRLDKVNVSCSLSYGRYHSYSSTDVYPDYRRVQRRRSLKLYCVLKADVSESEPSLDIVFRVFYIHTYIWGVFMALLWWYSQR